MINHLSHLIGILEKLLINFVEEESFSRKLEIANEISSTKKEIAELLQKIEESLKKE